MVHQNNLRLRSAGSDAARDKSSSVAAAPSSAALGAGGGGMPPIALDLTATLDLDLTAVGVVEG